MKINRDNIYFVLVEPQTPGNIGAAARALKTMGFRNLVLVNPCDHLAPEARWMAHAAEDILENAVIYGGLGQAVADMHFTVATTQRNRSFHLPYYTAAEVAHKSVPVSLEHQVAVVFGREKTGLTNEELTLCDAFSTIPAYTSHPSLNLAQAVMVYCYELFQAAYGDEKKYHWKLATHSELETLYRHLEKSLKRVGFVPIDTWENFIMRFSRLLGRSNAELRDVKVWHKILKSFEQYIDQMEEELVQVKSQKNETS